MESESNEQRFTNVKGIALYKVSYEMDIKGDSNPETFTAGVVAYSNEEALQTLTNHCKNNITGFKGMKINEMAFEGLVHAMSDKVEKAIINKAIAMGKVVHPRVVADLKKEMNSKPATKKTSTKRSILPKE